MIAKVWTPERRPPVSAGLESNRPFEMRESAGPDVYVESRATHFGSDPALTHPITWGLHSEVYTLEVWSLGQWSTFWGLNNSEGPSL